MGVKEGFLGMLRRAACLPLQAFLANLAKIAGSG
jgi:hypothetical protein